MSRFLLLSPYLLLILLIAIVFGALFVLGLNLGFFGDILQFEYVLQSLGIRDAMRWFSLEAFNRHPIASHHYAFVHLISPGNSTGWYATSLLYHFVTAIPAFLFLDALLRQRWRVLSLAITLLFLFHVRQYQSYFGDAFSGFVRLSLAIEMLSLWFYLQYVRRSRKNHWWRDASIVLYFVSVNLYETTFLFIGLHVIIAWVEDQHNGVFYRWRTWLWQIFKDNYLYLVFTGMYLYFLIVYFPNTSVRVAPSLIVPEILRLLVVEFTGYIGRLLPAFSSEWLLLTIVLSVLSFVILWYRGWRISLQDDYRRMLIVLFVLAWGMMIFNALLSVQTAFLPADTPRLAYPFQLGFAAVIVSTFAYLLHFLSDIRLQHIIFTGVVAVVIGASVTILFLTRHDHALDNQIRQDVLTAVQEAVPQFSGDTPPYILLLTDEAYNETMIAALHARDANFARHFALLYGVDDIGGDVLYLDLPANLQPAEGVHGSHYRGPYIVIEEEGIYSPLRPLLPQAYEPSDPDGLVILYYDPDPKQVRVLDEIPIALLEKANMIDRVFAELRTNRDLLQVP